MAKSAAPNGGLLTIEKTDVVPVLETWRREPEVFFRSVLNADPYDKQIDVLHSLADPDVRKVAVKSCNAAGKDWLGARVATWWMSTWEECAVVTTAPTWHQVKDIVWREIGNAWLQASFPLSAEPPNKVDWSLSPKRFAMGLSTTEKERFMGIHNDNILIIVTEASGMPEEIMDAIDTLTASGNAKLLYLGNPTVTDGAFFDAFGKDSSLFELFTIPAWDTPNFQGNGVVRPYLILPSWVDERRVKWGEGSMLWQAHVEAQFPDEDSTQVFTSEIIAAAVNREVRIDPEDDSSSLGVDVARKGVNKTSYCMIRGNAVTLLTQQSKTKTTEVTTHVCELADHGTTIAIDDSGVGGGVVDQVEEKGYEVIPFLAGSTARDNKRFANSGSEAWWALRDALMNFLSLAMLKDRPDLLKDLIDQLKKIKYETDGKERILVNKKERGEKWRNVNHESPDLAEALMIALVAWTEEATGAEYFMF